VKNIIDHGSIKGINVKNLIINSFIENINLFIKKKTVKSGMSDNNSTIPDTEENRYFYTITFILLLIVEIPSILCTIFILIFFVFNWHLLVIKVLHNHVTFLSYDYLLTLYNSRSSCYYKLLSSSL
jgi:hypothetical protein